MMLAGSLGRLRDLTDYAAYGGAPILGFEHLLIKAHGRSSAPAITNAVKVAAKAVRDGVTREIAAAVGRALMMPAPCRQRPPPPPAGGLPLGPRQDLPEERVRHAARAGADSVREAGGQGRGARAWRR